MKARLALTLTVAMLLLPAAAWCLDSGRRLSQYAHTVWRLSDGAFDGVPRAIAQTRDGYLWLGTSTGLVRYDGARFVRYVPPPGERLRSPTVNALLAAKDGSLWIATRATVDQLKDGHLLPRAALGNAQSLVEAPDGAVWVARIQASDENGALCRVDAGEPRCFGPSDGVSIPISFTLARTPDGTFWMSSGDAAHRWRADGGASVRIPLGGQGVKPLGDGIGSFAMARDGSLWVGSMVSGRGLGLQRLIDDAWVPVDLPGFAGASIKVSALLRDRDDSLWVGTIGQGLWRLREGHAEHLGMADGLSSDTITSLFEDSQGNLWVTTTQGLERFRDLRVATFGSGHGLSEDSASAVLGARDGSVWVENFHALDRIVGGTVEHLTFPRDLPGQAATSLMEDAVGRLWVGVDDGVLVLRGRAIKRIAPPDGKPFGNVEQMFQDKGGDVWILAIGGVTGSRVFRVRGDVVQEELTDRFDGGASSGTADARDGVWIGRPNGDFIHRASDGKFSTVTFPGSGPGHVVRMMMTASDGAIFAATNRGLEGWREGRVATLTSANGLPCDRLSALAQDLEGGLWLYTACGLVQVQPQALQAWWQNPEARVPVRVFDALDGAQPGTSDFTPKATRSSDGRLWFVNGNLLQSIDPARLARDPAPPLVHIEELVADGTRYPNPQSLQLKPRTRDIAIDYTAPRFAIPQRVQFRYRLEGHDTQWQEPGTRRQAFYTDLPPGDYRFQVIAANEDGAWNESGATIAISIPPTFVQTKAFIALCGLAGMVLILLLVQMRERRAARQARLRAEERMGERERIARELHDTLLQSTQALSLRVQGVIGRVGAESRMRPELEDIVRRADEAVAEGRDRILELRAERRSVHESLVSLARELRRDDGPEVDVTARGAERPLSARVADESLRIAREALLNALRHAEAKHIELQVAFDDDAFRLRVADDGIGVDADIAAHDKAGHFGLRTMRERASLAGGQLRVERRPAGGTLVELEVPAKNAYAPAARASP